MKKQEHKNTGCSRCGRVRMTLRIGWRALCARCLRDTGEDEARKTRDEWDRLARECEGLEEESLGLKRSAA